MLNLSIEKYGEFDVILCLGIFYHIDVPDSFSFVEKMAQTCRSLLIVDTHIAMRNEKSHTYRGKQFHGVNYIEWKPEVTAAERQKGTWSSLDNDNSFWFTRPSLHNLLAMNGFTSVYTCNTPVVEDWLDRDTIVALKGEPVEISAVPGVPEMKLAGETNGKGLHPSQRPPKTFVDRIAGKLGLAKN